MRNTVEQDRLARLRSEFPGAAAGPYLDVAARGLLYAGGRAALDRYLDQTTSGTVDKAALFAAVEATRTGFAALIRAEPDEIAFTRNVTDGIASFAAALPWQEGDNVVICEDLEHPANTVPWYGIGRTRGVAIKAVRPEGGHLAIEPILAAIDARTRVVTVASISFSPGFRFPVAELGAECRRRGVLLVVDAAQSVGVIDTDVTAWQADVIAASTQKGLLALYGLGFLYVRREVADRLHPVCLSRFSLDLGVAHEAAAADGPDYRLAPGARRFDMGNYNYPAIVAVDRSIALLRELGSAAVERHACGLAAAFAEGLLDLGLPVYGGRPGPHSSHLVSLGRSLGKDHDSTDDRDLVALHAFLTGNGVRLSIRRDLLRFSFHIYNDRADVERVLALATSWLGARPGVARQRIA